MKSQSVDTFSCTIEIYLLKKHIRTYDTVLKKSVPLLPTKEDLQDTPFIKNPEFLLFRIEKLKVKGKGLKRYTRYRCTADMSDSLDFRMEPLNLATKLAAQFAFVVNGKIIYGGYFLHWTTQMVPHGVCAFASGKRISFQYPLRDDDPRLNKDLLRCLRNSKRLSRVNEKNGR